ncbi:LOW QUALITY PROTEIN: hypothetical protein V1477_001184 [Vespula maculifrons]|uniref:Uncharacterized protein n=1 Tax=Vespula maculifrons TaxID=7453 RepID=A0ABD2D126_VESMC
MLTREKLKIIILISGLLINFDNYRFSFVFRRVNIEDVFPAIILIILQYNINNNEELKQIYSNIIHFFNTIYNLFYFTFKLNP